MALTDAAKPVARWTLGHALPRLVLTRAANRGDLQGRLVVESTSREPWELLEEIRATGPLSPTRFGGMTTSHALVREVLSGADYVSGRPSGPLPGIIGALLRWSTVEALGPLDPPSLLVVDGADHLRYRKLVTRVFTVKAVDALRTQTESIAIGLLDSLADRPVVDIVATYCALLPVTVISTILGVPLADRDRVLGFGGAVAPSLDLGLSWRTFRDVESSMAEFDAWLEKHLDKLRHHPGDDLLSQLVAAREDGQGLTDRELRSIAGLVLAAGFETTVNLLSNGIALLCTHPDQLTALQNDPDLWPNAVDEILRLDPPVMLTGRVTTSEVQLGGKTLPSGSLVTTLLAAANRDPDVFEDPTRFDVTRANAKEHVSFSNGRHFCLGAALARMEGEVGLRALFDRYPQLVLAPGGTRRTTRILRGWERLPVRLRPLTPEEG